MHICLQPVQVLQLTHPTYAIGNTSNYPQTMAAWYVPATQCDGGGTPRTGTAHESSQDEEMKAKEPEVIPLTWFGEQVKDELEEDPSGSTGSTASPLTIRIGHLKHGYVYAKKSEVLYKCCRGSDNCPTDHKLFLRKGADGQWVAYDAPDNDNSPPMGNPIFDSYEDILVAGMHSWRIVECKDGDSKFMTTVLET